MPRIKSDKVEIWAAVNPEGVLVVSSIGAYRSAALRWAAKYRNHTVVKVAEIERNHDFLEVLPRLARHEEEMSSMIPTKKRGPGRPRKDHHNA